MKKRVLLCSLSFLMFFLSGCQQPQIGVTGELQKGADGVIAFSRLTGNFWQIWMIRPDGGRAKQITFSPSDKRYPIWAPSGEELLFRTNDNQAWLVNIVTGQEKRIFKSFGLTGGAIPAPDGSKFVFTRYRDHLKDSCALWLAGLDGTEEKILTSHSGMQYDPAWSPDGWKIVYVSAHGYRTDEIYVIEVDGMKKHRLTSNDAREFLPVFSPDGRTIVYVSDVTSNYEIWLMDADGGNKRQLTNSKGIDTRPYWSPDGNEIIFVSSRSGSLQLWIMGIDGSNPRQLTYGAPSMDPAWKGH